MLEIKKVGTEGADLEQFRTLLREYTAELDENLTFQHFDEELENPLGKYGPPYGSLLIAFYDGELAGCVALQKIDASICEMKRMFVRKVFRQFSIGKALAPAILAEARTLGYKRMVLDSLEKLQAAIGLYKKLGFTETKPYYENPLPGAIFMEMVL